MNTHGPRAASMMSVARPDSRVEMPQSERGTAWSPERGMATPLDHRSA
jgi:hypothetical protein